MVDPVAATSSFNRWRTNPVPSAELAGIVIGAARAYRDAKAEQELEVVWAGPAGPSIATRRTDQARLQVIDVAKPRLFVTSFVAYKVPSIVKALDDAMNRGVRLSMLLEPSESEGGGISFDVIRKMKAELPKARILTWATKSRNSRAEAFMPEQYHSVEPAVRAEPGAPAGGGGGHERKRKLQDRDRGRRSWWQREIGALRRLSGAAPTDAAAGALVCEGATARRFWLVLSRRSPGANPTTGQPLQRIPRAETAAASRSR